MVVYEHRRIGVAILGPRTLGRWGQELWARVFPRCFLLYVGVGLRVKAWTVEVVFSFAVGGGYGCGFSVTRRVKGPALFHLSLLGLGFGRAEASDGEGGEGLHDVVVHPLAIGVRSYSPS